MTQKVIIAMVIVVVILALALVALNWEEIQLKSDINRYNRVIVEELPENIELTIYYLPHDIATRSALSKERLMNMDETVKIVVTAEELSKHKQTLGQLNTSSVQISEENWGLNARIYYVFKVGDQVLLEVVMQQFVGDDKSFGAFVNDICVKKSAVLYEVILPFLTESDCEKMGLVIPDNTGHVPLS